MTSQLITNISIGIAMAYYLYVIFASEDLLIRESPIDYSRPGSFYARYNMPE